MNDTALSAAIRIRPDAERGALLALAAIIAILVLYHVTVWSMILLWWHSQTFAHGFAIVPISAWLVWRQRQLLAAIPQQPGAAGVALLLGLGAVWLLAYIANVQVVAQYAVTAMIPAAVIGVLGWPIARAMAFPLAYLLLAVPFGEVFLPSLIDFTARFTVGALQLTGVPVFRDNNEFSIPSGNWSVAEACSGLRYVIASLALGTLYAYLNYRSNVRRMLFIVVALLLPVIANGMRAYLIVMLGHLSDMRLAVGVDHVIYGWIFFGMVSLLLYWLASFWRDACPAPAPVPSSALLHLPAAPRGAAAAACIVVAACWPILAATMAGRTSAVAPAQPRLMLAAPGGTWLATPTDPLTWRAFHLGASQELLQSYRSTSGAASVQLAVYARQVKGADLLALAESVKLFETIFADSLGSNFDFFVLL
ncbi:exosortase A [Oxalobacteraceae bacterium GrIS 1.11]